ncbi:hypothetical protein [Pseudomonas sp. ML96]|uniref:hypothetical protein n=1 Tax=Pseudomonas sp. ML96 TaxID=1523503 RepID=UPI0012E0AE95|nr:hypothetical protein [Pseudomonas sp. ML96]
MIALILLFNQGILTRDRVQVENAADAAAYSQAKLFARHQNLIAYTNRAIVANELSIGQVVALMSWSKRYANIPRWVNSFPAYQVPILLIPPKPSIADVLNAVTLPYQILGYGVRAAATPVMKIYPDVVSSFNMIMGFFQKAFAIATFEAQARIPGEIVKQHQLNKPGDKLEVAPLSTMLLVQNFILTYFADYLPIDALLEQVRGANSGAGGAAGGGAAGGTSGGSTTDPAPSDDDLLADFLGGVTPGSMLVNLAPEMHNKTGTSKSKDMTTTGEASRYFAATINEQRNAWLSDRTFDAAVGFSTPEISLPLGFINIKFSFGFEVGVFNNGGTAYVYNPLSTSSAGKAIPVFGWSSLDFSSMGFKLDVNLAIELCLPGLGCITIFDDGINFGLGLPLGGATQQLVTNVGDQYLFGPQWGSPAQGILSSKFRPYGEALHPVHAVTYGWGIFPLMIYGTNLAEDVNTGYSGSPSFFVLGDDHAETGRSKEFTVAVSKPLTAIRTSDNPDSLNLRPVADSSNVLNRKGRFALQTEGVDDNPLVFLWGDGERMMTISSAETYFAPPPGREESPNQYSPFWDARLREPSQIVQFMASGKIDLTQILNVTPANVAGYLFDLARQFVIEPGRDRLLDKLPPLIKPAAKPVLEKITDEVLDQAKAGVSGALE